MNPDKALELINRVCAQVPLVREVHKQVEDAIASLSKAIKPLPPSPEE